MNHGNIVLKMNTMLPFVDDSSTNEKKAEGRLLVEVIKLKSFLPPQNIYTGRSTTNSYDIIIWHVCKK